MNKNKTLFILWIVISLSSCNNVPSSEFSVSGSLTPSFIESLESIEDPFVSTVESSNQESSDIYSSSNDTPIFDKGGWDQDSLNYINPNPSLKNVDDNCTFYDYSDVSYGEVAKISGKLEDYLLQNNMLGIPLMNYSTNFIKINSRISLPTNAYINGYGFGIIEDGKISSLSNNEENNDYYHITVKNFLDFSFLNNSRNNNPYLNLVHSSYFSKKLNDKNDGYIYFPSLATDDNVVSGEYRPVPIDENNNVILNANRKTLSSTYRIYVKTGKDATYNSLSNDETTQSYIGREVELEDYLTPFKQYFNKLNYSNVTSSLIYSIKGLNEYFETTQEGFNEQAWENVGIKSGSDKIGDYLQFTFTKEMIPFNALYYLSNVLFSPIPSSFLDKIGGIRNYMSNENTFNYSLSIGPYLIEDYVKNEKVVLKKNANINKDILGGNNRYNLEGIHIDINENADDLHYLYSLYNEGLIDYAEIPDDLVGVERDKKDTYTAGNGGVMSLMMNSCDENSWEELFGENGTIKQTKKEDYWNVKPAMSNDNFLKGLQLSINRQELAIKHNTTPAISFFNDQFNYDLENESSYINTQYHKQNLLNYYGSEAIVNNFGFDLNESRKYFSLAANELLESRKYKEGDVIEIEVCWQTKQQTIDYGEDFKSYIEKAFNDSSVCNNKLTLNIVNTYIEVWSDIYYKKMYCGKYDIAFGFFTAGSFQPVSAFEYFVSKNPTNMTVSWGENTNSSDKLIEYDDRFFTFDALWKCANTGGYVNEDGTLATTFDAVLVSNLLNEDGSRTITFNYDSSTINDSSVVSITKVELWWYDAESQGEYAFKEIEFIDEKGVITINLDAETVSNWIGKIIIDIHYSDSDKNNYYLSFETSNNKTTY